MAQKKLKDSMTVRASLITVIAFLIVKWAGLPEEVAQSIAVVGAGIAMVYLRRAVGDNGESAQ